MRMKISVSILELGSNTLFVTLCIVVAAGNANWKC